MELAAASVIVDRQTQRADKLATATSLGPLGVLVNCAGISRAQRTVNAAGEPSP